MGNMRQVSCITMAFLTDVSPIMLFISYTERAHMYSHGEHISVGFSSTNWLQDLTGQSVI